MSVHYDRSSRITNGTNVLGVNADGSIDVTPATGAEYEVTQDTHDDLNANANIQVANADVGMANPVPVKQGTDIKFAVTVAAGDDASLGNTTAAPYDGDEDATARTSISLLKGLKNYIKSAKTALGATTGAAVVTDADGTIQQYLRGIVKLIAAKITVGIDQTTPGTTNKVDIGSSPAAMTLATGEVQGNAAATVFPTLACKLVNIKAAPDNAGKVYIGVSGVTKADGTSDTTTGWVLSAGEETGFLPISNMSSLYRICDNAGDDVVYMALS